jgi:hypothetical protein
MRSPEEIREGTEAARIALDSLAATAAYLLGVPAEDVERVAGS